MQGPLQCHGGTWRCTCWELAIGGSENPSVACGLILDA